MSFGFLLGILVRVRILYYKSVKEPVYLQYTHLLLFGFFKKKSWNKKYVCANRECESWDLRIPRLPLR